MATAFLQIRHPGATLRDITHARQGDLHDVQRDANTGPAEARPQVALSADTELDTLQRSGCGWGSGESRGCAGGAGGRQHLSAPVWRAALH